MTLSHFVPLFRTSSLSAEKQMVSLHPLVIYSIVKSSSVETFTPNCWINSFLSNADVAIESFLTSLKMYVSKFFLTGLNILTLKFKDWFCVPRDTLPVTVVPGELELLRLASVMAVSGIDTTLCDTPEG